MTVIDFIGIGFGFFALGLGRYISIFLFIGFNIGFSVLAFQAVDLVTQILKITFQGVIFPD